MLGVVRVRVCITGLKKVDGMLSTDSVAYILHPSGVWVRISDDDFYYITGHGRFLTAGAYDVDCGGTHASIGLPREYITPWLRGFILEWVSEDVIPSRVIPIDEINRGGD